MKNFKNTIDIVKFVAKIAGDKKAEYIRILNVGPRLVITDYFIIISAGNTRLTRRIAEDIEQNLKKFNLIPINISGFTEGNWILIDYNDFVIHIFTEEYRAYYDLERLWRDSKIIRFTSSGSGKNKEADKQEDYFEVRDADKDMNSLENQ